MKIIIFRGPNLNIWEKSKKIGKTQFSSLIEIFCFFNINKQGIFKQEKFRRKNTVAKQESWLQN